MAEETITLTEAELNAKIEEAVGTATKDLIAKHNSEMAKMRKENKDLKDANLSADDRAKKEFEEQQEATLKELSELRAYKRSSLISERLAKEGLPTYFRNDNRLLTAEEGNLDKVIKEIRKEYEATLPKGNQHSSVVNQSGGVKPNTTPQSEAYAQLGSALKDIIGK